MSDSDTAILFLATTDLPTAVVTVFDGDLRLVAKGTGSVLAVLPPGLYKVQCRLSTEFIEEIVEHTAEKPAQWQLSGPLLASPVPLQGTRLHRESHERSLTEAGRVPPSVRLGTGARITICVRDPEADPHTEAATELPLAGLSIAATDCAMPLQKLDEHSIYNTSVPVPYGLWTAEVNSGSYILRLDTGAGASISQFVHLPDGWHTWLIALRTVYPGPTGPKWRADLEGAAILLSRPGSGLGDEEFKLAECVRVAIRSGGTASEDWLLSILQGRFSNPMLGLYGAYLLVGSGQKSSLYESAMLAKLRHLLGDEHPDVCALRLALNPETDVAPFNSPPMLHMSWEAVCRASVQRPEIVPEGSLTESIARRIWGTPPHLLWLEPPKSTLEGFQPADATSQWDDLQVAILRVLATKALAESGWKRNREDVEVDVPAEPAIDVLEAFRLPARIVRSAYRTIHTELTRTVARDGMTTTDGWRFRPEQPADISAQRSRRNEAIASIRSRFEEAWHVGESNDGTQDGPQAKSLLQDVGNTHTQREALQTIGKQASEMFFGADAVPPVQIMDLLPGTEALTLMTAAVVSDVSKRMKFVSQRGLILAKRTIPWRWDEKPNIEEIEIEIDKHSWRQLSEQCPSPDGTPPLRLGAYSLLRVHLQLPRNVDRLRYLQTEDEMKDRSWRSDSQPARTSRPRNMAHV